MDPERVVVSGVAGQLTNPGLGGSRTTGTNESGLYVFSALPPGTYNLKVELSGFRPVQMDKLELRVDTQSRADVQVELAGISASVTVQAESPILNTTDASLGNTLNELAIRSLPVEARNAVHIVSLQPGVVFVPTN